MRLSLRIHMPRTYKRFRLVNCACVAPFGHITHLVHASRILHSCGRPRGRISYLPLFIVTNTRISHIAIEFRVPQSNPAPPIYLTPHALISSSLSVCCDPNALSRILRSCCSTHVCFPYLSLVFRTSHLSVLHRAHVS